MANFFNGFLDNLTQGLTRPKGNLGDFQHAARLYNSNAFRLAPKVKFLYHVVFNINPLAMRSTLFDTQKHGTAVNMLVKQVDLPKFKIDVDTPIQYNRKKKVQTKLDFDPLNIVFHDDNTGLTTQMWRMYYGYYFADGKSPNAYYRNTYQSEAANLFRYGLDNNSSVPFFTSITIYQMARHYYQSYMLVNPIVSSWQHDTLNNEESGSVQSTMQINYESVIYGSGQVSSNTVPGFATEYYDKQPSPLSLLGGGTVSLFGQGGIVGGAADILGEIASGNIFTVSGFLGTLIKGANIVSNTKKLTSEGVRQEGYNILTSALGATAGIDVSGVANTVFPKTGGTGQTQTTTSLAPAENIKASPLTAAEQASITSNPVALNSLTNLAIANGVVGPGSAAQSQVQNLLSSGRNIKLNNLAKKVSNELKS